MIVMTRPQYDALLSLAKAQDAAAAAEIQTAVDAASGITRYVLVIRWQDVGGQQPRTLAHDQDWPPETRYVLELERAISRQDVLDVLTHNASNPVGTQVTPDPDGELGWYLLEDYLF